MFRVVGILVAAMVMASINTDADAKSYPGDCGKPTASFLSGGPDLPTAQDSLYALKAGVGTAYCAKFICDTDNNGSVLAGDALRILRKAVKQPVTLTCPPCKNDPDNNPGTNDREPSCICDTTQLLAKLDEDTAITKAFTNMASSFVAFRIGCADTSSTFSVAPSSWTALRRNISASDVWINGSPDVTVVPNPPCWGSTASAENNPNVCSNTDSGSGAFMRLEGDNLGVAGFTVKGFFEGLHFAGKNGTAGNMTFDRQCDDSITNELAKGVGSEVRDTVIKRGCDKCTQDEAGPAIVAEDCEDNERECYHLAYRDVSFRGCEKAFRFANTAANGRFALSRITDEPIASWPCHGSEIGATDLEVTLESVVVNGCDAGVVVGNGSHVMGGQSRIVNNLQRGIITKGELSLLTVLDTKIVNNGGQNSTDLTGGVVATESSVVNLGSAPENGHNCIHGNESQAGNPWQVVNYVDNLNLQAQYNWWENMGDPPPASTHLVLKSRCSISGDTCGAGVPCDAGDGTCQTVNSIVTSNALTTAQKPSFCATGP